MMIPLTCPNGHKLTVPVSAAGQRMRCPTCDATLAVPNLELDIFTDLEPADLLLVDEDVEVPSPSGHGLFAVSCPSCRENITFSKQLAGKKLLCPHCDYTLLTVVEDEPTLHGLDRKLTNESREPIAVSAKDTRMKFAVTGCAAGIGILLVALICAVFVNVRIKVDQIVDQAQPRSVATTPNLPPSSVDISSANTLLPAPKLSKDISDRASFWLEVHEVGRRSSSWLYVNVTPHRDGTRTARIKVADGSQQFPELMLADEEGVPLFECSPFNLKYRGWPTTETPLPDDTQRDVLRSTKETELYRISELTDFGTGSFDRGDDDQQSFDHRHAWSSDGRYLYVLSGLNRGHRKQSLRKVNTQTWQVEREIRPAEDVMDIAWTSQGLVVIADPLLVDPRKFTTAEPWVKLVPSNQQLERYRGGIFLLDADTLAVRRAWVTPRVQEVAGNANSDLIYLRSPKDAILAVNVRTGELLSCYSYHDLHHHDFGERTLDELHFRNPHLSTNGSSLVTHGMNNVIISPRTSRTAKHSLGPRSVNQFRLSGAIIEWEQSRRVGGIRSRFTRRADVGFGDDFLCVPNQRYEVVSVDELDDPLARLSLPPETAVAVDSSSKSLFLCWPDWRAKQLRFRAIRGTTDTELALAAGIEPNTDRTKFSQSRFSDEVMLHRNLWPYEMSAAPNGRGAIVFTPDSAYWVEAKFGADSKWAFASAANGPSNSQGKGTASNAAARQHAERLTRCKRATVLLNVASKGRFGSAFCINNNGYLLTNLHHVDDLPIGSDLTIVVDAGGMHQRTATATLDRISTAAGVALLKTDPHSDLVPLGLGHDELLSEAASLTAFGYPRVPDLETSAGLYPSVGVKPGTATALRRSEGQLVTIQFDGALQLGYSGGPVVDSAGSVVGIVRLGIEPLGLNFLVPAAQLRQLNWPELKVTRQIAQEEPAKARPTATMSTATTTKAATALVVLPSSRGFGTAFCVDERGFFATNSHVVKGLADSDVVTLVLHSGEANECLARAKLVRKIDESDLALLELIDKQEHLSVLELEESKPLTEQMKVKALGFPFGDALAVRGKQYPSISVNVARIVATRTTALGHESFEFHTQLNPGNSGGPVVNDAGKVVGVVFATQIGARKSFAIHASRLRELMYSPALKWKTLAVDYPNRRRESTFPVIATPFLRSLAGLELELRLKPDYGPEKIYSMAPSDSEGSYEVRAPLVASDIPDYLNATFTFANGSISGVIADREVSIGAAKFMLSAVPEDAFLGNQTVSGLEGLSFGIGDRNYKIDGSLAISATVKPFRTSSVEYTVVARQDGREVARLRGDIDVSIRVTSEERTHRFVRQLERVWAGEFTNSELHPLKVAATFESGSITGLTSDRRFHVTRRPDPEEYSLSEVNRIAGKNQPDPADRSRYIRSFDLRLTGDGRVRGRSSSGTQLPGLEQVPVRVGSSEVVLDLTAANACTVERQHFPNISTLQLNTPIADIAAGGRGRWLILHLPEFERLVVFDVLARKVRHQIPLADRNTLFAAGAKELLVVFPKLKAVQRWDLSSGKHERTTTLALEGTIGSVAMGAGGDGPLLMHGYDTSLPPAPRWTLVDLQTLVPSAVVAPIPKSSYPLSPPLTASVDGKAFGTLDLALLLKDASVESVPITYDKPKVQFKYIPYLVTAGNTSNQLFYRNLIYTARGQLLGAAPKFSTGYPTYDQRYTLGFAYAKTQIGRKPHVTIYENNEGKLRRLVVLESTPIDGLVAPTDGRLPLRKRYHLYPEARLLVSVPLGDDTLKLHNLPMWKK